MLYNGSNGASYASLSLSGSVGNQCGGHGTAVVDAAGMQNGGPDGLALVDAAAKLVSAGHAYHCDCTGEDVPVGQVGELWTRSHQNMAGYWNNPAATAEAVTEEAAPAEEAPQAEAPAPSRAAPTRDLFTNPQDPRTEDYITGRFG